jgi:hypothetical protein
MGGMHHRIAFGEASEVAGRRRKVGRQGRGGGGRSAGGVGLRHVGRLHHHDAVLQDGNQMTDQRAKIKRFNRNDSCVLRAGRVSGARGVLWGRPRWARNRLSGAAE